MLCASCKKEWTPTDNDAGFVTCSVCRKPHVPSKRQKGNRYSATRKNRDWHDPSPWEENNVRHLEDN